MKTARTYTIDEDLVKKIKNSGENASNLINNLLSTYFTNDCLKTKSIEELELMLKLEQDKKEIENKLNTIKNGNN